MEVQLSFGEFRLDLQQRRLWRGEIEVLLAPKAFEVLFYLVDRRGELVPREQLMKELWPDTFVDDHALSFQIAEVRKALGDDPKIPRYIETRPRRGYRFLAPIDPEGDGVDGQSVVPPPPLLPPPTPRPSALVVPPRVGSDGMPETHYARSGDVNIAYQVVGEGPVDIVFVMGWVSHLEYFWREPRFAAFLRRLASFSRLILFDKRGTGLSDRVPVNQLPTLEQRMDDVRAVMDAVGSRHALLVGVSEGGPMAVLFSATYPEKTLGLVMIGSYARRLRDVDYPWGPTRHERDAYCELIRAQWGGPVGIDDRAPSLAADPEFRQWWATYLRMGASPGAAEALTRMNAEIDIRAVLPTIRVPALVIHRTADRCLLVEEGRFMASLIRNARFVELPGADHLPFVGDPEQILEEIERFATGVGSRPEPELALATALFLEMPAEPQFRARVRREIEWFRGREADRETGAPVATFDGPARAVRCAMTIVTQARKLSLSTRAALHTGECEFSIDGRLSGYTVDLTSRILAETSSGQVVVSRVVKDLVAGSGIQFVWHADLRLPGDGDPWPLFSVVSC